MLYKIVASANGREVSRMVQAETPEAALAKFVEDWTEHGDPEPVGAYIAESWSQTY